MHHAVYKQEPHRVHFSPVVSQLRYREARNCLRPIKGKVPGEDAELLRTKLLESSMQNTLSLVPRADTAPSNSHLRNQTIYPTAVQYQHAQHHGNFYGQPLTCPTTFYSSVVQQNIFVHGLPTEGNLPSGSEGPRATSSTLPSGTSVQRFVDAGSGNTPERLKWETFPGATVTENARGYDPSRIPSQMSYHNKASAVYQNSYVYEPESVAKHFTFHQKMPNSSAHKHVYQNLSSLQSEKIKLMNNNEESGSKLIAGEASGKRFSNAMSDFEPSKVGGTTAGSFEKETPGESRADNNDNVAGAFGVMRNNNNIRLHCNNGQHSDCRRNFIKSNQPKEFNCSQGTNKCECKNKSGSGKSFNKLSKNFLHWITMGRLGGDTVVHQKQRRSNKEIELISSTKSNAIGKSVDKKFKNKSSDNSSLSYNHRRGSASDKKLLPVTVPNWPVKANSNFLSETLDFHQSTAAEPCCSYPSSAMEQLGNLKERERGVKIRSSDVHPGEAIQSAGRGQRERGSEFFFHDPGSEFDIWGANDMKQDRANERCRTELLDTVCGTTVTGRGSDESHSCTSTAALEELLTDDEQFGSRPDLENSEEEVKELRQHDTCTLPVPRLDPADLPVIRSQVSVLESKQSRNGTKNEMKEAARHRKDASTSPIQHLSTFHALNVPVVLPRPEIHKDGSKPDEENSLLLPSVPVPKPRSIKSHVNVTSPQLVPESATSSVKAETDELSANVEKILDEIADLELECLKWNTSNVMGTNILDSLQDLSEEGTDELDSSDSAQPPGNQLILGSQSGRSILNSNNENQAPNALRSKESGSSVKLKQLSRVTGKPPRPRLINRCSKGMRDEFLSNGMGTSENTGMEQVVGTSRGRDGMRKPGGDLDAKLLKFREQLHRSREELAKSHPNLDEIQETVRSSVVIDRSDTRGQRASTVRAIHPYTPYTLHTGGVSSYAGANGNYTATITSVVTGAVCTSPTRTSDTSKLSGCNLALTPDPVTLDKERRISQEWNQLCNKGSVNHVNKLRKNQFQLARANSSPGPQFGTQHGNFNCESERHNSSGIIETDLDAGISPFTVDENGHLEFICPDDSLPNPSWSGGDTCADDVFDHEEFPQGKLRKSVMQLPLSIFDDEHGILTNSLNSKTKSLVNLGLVPSSTSVRDSSIKSATLSGKYRESNMEETSGLLSVGASQDEKARSMEFLLEDSDKNAHLLPPENNLMRGENRQLSEHELRIQRSLNKLNVPDWYKSYGRSGSASGGVTPTSTPPGHSTSGSKSKIFGSGTGLAGGWSGLSSSKTSSLTSLQSTGRYSGGRSHFNRIRSSGTQSGGARSSRESLMSPSSTASASPSPYYERSSFTYGMPYALTRFATARMSCGASPASLSPSPSPVGGVGSSTSTPVTSAPLSRHHSYSKAPYLGWRSQERLASKSLYRSPAERLAADLLAQKQKNSGSQTSSGGSGTTTPSTEVTTEKRMELTETETSKAETVSASDLSLNNSEESSSKLHRVRSSIKEVSNAIVDYVNESKPLDEGINGGAVSPRKGFVWLETAFVGTKPIDSPGTPDTPGVVMSNSRLESDTLSAAAGNGRAKNVFHFEDQGTENNSKSSGLASQRMRSEEDSYTSAANNGSATVCSPYSSRNGYHSCRHNVF